MRISSSRKISLFENIAVCAFIILKEISHNLFDGLISFAVKSFQKNLEEYVVLYDSRDLSANDIERIIEDGVSVANRTYHFEFPVRNDCVFMTKKAFECVFRSMLNKEGKTDGSL